MGYEAKMVLDSINENGIRLCTMEVTYPRIIHSEMMTHRAFSRNSASSRAIPVDKMIKRVMEDPFIPAEWPANEKGMQSSKNLDALDSEYAKYEWLAARDRALDAAETLRQRGVHKQITNRLLEPFLWHTVIVSATEWSNFFALRCDTNAQAEIRTAALMMKKLYDEGTPTLLEEGKWHMPYITAEDKIGYCTEDLLKIATGRIARVSYLTHDGIRDPQKDIELHDRLSTSGHWSPFEHCAKAYITAVNSVSNFHKSWWQYRKEFYNECR